MSRKFIPNGDPDFKHMAESFARIIARDPARFALSQEASDALTDAVERYARAFMQAKFGSGRSPATTRRKNEARAAAEEIIRRLARTIRANEDVDQEAKFALKLRTRTDRPKRRNVPLETPRLWFVRALHEANAPLPMHELKFRALNRSQPKPAGAVRLELFVDLVPPEEPVPAHPGANLNSRPWYLRSFTRSPIVLTPPMTTMPMRVMYWGRWADSTGNVGPFSQTVVAWVEGGTHHVDVPQFNRAFEPKMVPLPDAVRHASDNVAHVESLVRGELCSDAAQAERPGGRSLECSVMLLEAQRMSYQRTEN